MCDNHRGISLLWSPGKILERLLLNCLICHLEKGLPKSQCGFCKDRGTVHAIFAAYQLQGKCQEHNDKIYCNFLDLTKELSMEGLWRIMQKFGFQMTRQLHNGMQAQVQNKYRVQETLPSPVCKFLFADNCALNAKSAADMQFSMDRYAQACRNFGLTISTKKIVLHQPHPGEDPIDQASFLRGMLKCGLLHIPGQHSLKTNP
ncbi:uncharacterized protein LOC119572490 [Penaeus monodon]|uniref:uncharacterized protein LOC119572490 n=1 Tax=Penaeus monodon TaxID=6687 RepID=UPI0018A6F2FF|nr:uncharacterized protein LOC119572490 [Penaeus monodon]